MIQEVLNVSHNYFSNFQLPYKLLTLALPSLVSYSVHVYEVYSFIWLPNHKYYFVTEEVYYGEMIILNGAVDHLRGILILNNSIISNEIIEFSNEIIQYLSNQVILNLVKKFRLPLSKCPYEKIKPNLRVCKNSAQVVSHQDRIMWCRPILLQLQIHLPTADLVMYYQDISKYSEYGEPFKVSK